MGGPKSTSINYTAGIGLWMVSCEQGRSSRILAAVALGLNPTLNNFEGSAGDHPHDYYDFQKCLTLIERVPEVREILPKLRERSRHWHIIVDNWKLLEDLSKSCPGVHEEKTYTRVTAVMRNLFEIVKNLDPQDAP